MTEIVGTSWRCFKDDFQGFSPWFSIDATAKLERSEVRREFILGDGTMWREPRSHQRSAALADIDVNVSINVLTIAVDDVFAVECVVLVPMARTPESHQYRQ